MSDKYQPGLRISEYLLQERLGMGSFGEVWRARHHVWERENVAIKLPTEPEYVRYLQREGLVVHGLRHPNIVRVIGLDPYAEIPYLVMELVDGPSLRDILDDHPKGIPVPAAVTIFRGILNAMAVAHEAGILHRDLKPSNVLLHLDGAPLEKLASDQVKVSDFGLGGGNADVMRSIAQSASLDRDNALVGTLAYMAPELRDGRRPADARSDLYSIGIVLFEMLTGERPAGAELPSTMRAEVPERLDNVFRRLYARYESRYAAAQEVLDELGGGDLPPLPVGAPPPPPVPQRFVEGGRCSACGGAVRPGDQFCTHCGQQLVPYVRRCSACNAFPGPHDRFCIFCGSKLPLAEA